MRVITGIAKGVNLNSPPGNKTRPTTDKVKEAIFSAVQFDAEGAVVLDLFAGSGQLGIEALSRGAQKAYFADNNPAAAAVVRENLEKTRLSDKARVDRLPYHAYLRLCKTKFDIAFLDPPYNKGILEKVFPALIPLMNPGGIIVCESESGLLLPETVGTFTADKAYHYGTIDVTIYRSEINEDSYLPREF